MANFPTDDTPSSCFEGGMFCWFAKRRGRWSMRTIPHLIPSNPVTQYDGRIVLKKIALDPFSTFPKPSSYIVLFLDHKCLGGQVSLNSSKPELNIFFLSFLFLNKTECVISRTDVQTFSTPKTIERLSFLFPQKTNQIFCVRLQKRVSKRMVKQGFFFLGSLVASKQVISSLKVLRAVRYFKTKSNA